METPLEIKSDLKVILNFEKCGQIIELSAVMPSVSKEDDYAVQYFGIWREIYYWTLFLKAKNVLEFGTREGYSTKLFSDALKHTGGFITTVDANDPKDKNDLLKRENVRIIKSKVEDLKWYTDVDILYIDDWHDPWHLYSELDKFARLARVVLIHDVCIEYNNEKSLLKAIEGWCIQNMIEWTVKPYNGCGMAVINIENSRRYYDLGHGGKRTNGEDACPDDKRGRMDSDKPAI